MKIFLALFLVGVVPVLFTFILPKKKIFFEKSVVKGFGLGIYTALIF